LNSMVDGIKRFRAGYTMMVYLKDVNSNITINTLACSKLPNSRTHDQRHYGVVSWLEPVR